jgi:putative oxidoreductase
MKKIVLHTMHHSPSTHELGHALLRIGIGVMLIVFGYGKLTSGTENITQIGGAMGLFGITFGYLFWGYLAALTEFCVGVCYVAGFLTRIASVPLICLLMVAIKFHLSKGDSFTVWGFPFTCLCIALTMLIAGGGKYSLDYMITHRE